MWLAGNKGKNTAFFRFANYLLVLIQKQLKKFNRTLHYVVNKTFNLNCTLKMFSRKYAAFPAHIFIILS